jgi:alkanesulfonate monooxygenase SsuD/methylene tetrahydromethanopterin reductase-like flavin-dependent oxidoreductase (luciferase family)
VKLGVLLPTFREGSGDALDTARHAEDSGLDGVFAFDHLWPIGDPLRPSLAPFPVLAAVAVNSPSLSIGPLVARVGLVGLSKFIERFMTLEALAPHRVIAALGTGDELSKDEHLAYGLDYPSAPARRVILAEALRALSPSFEVWCGAGSEATNRVARECHATLNLWGVPAAEVAEQAKIGPVNWAGPLGENAPKMLDALEEAGATWAVASEPSRIHEVSEWRRGR